jgi:hypothetical protein
VDPVPDPLRLRKSGSAGNRTLTSVARTSDCWTTEAVCKKKSKIKNAYDVENVSIVGYLNIPIVILIIGLCILLRVYQSIKVK